MDLDEVEYELKYLFSQEIFERLNQQFKGDEDRYEFYEIKLENDTQEFQIFFPRDENDLSDTSLFELMKHEMYDSFLGYITKELKRYTTRKAVISLYKTVEKMRNNSLETNNFREMKEVMSTYGFKVKYIRLTRFVEDEG